MESHGFKCVDMDKSQRNTGETIFTYRIDGHDWWLTEAKLEEIFGKLEIER